MNLRSIPLLFRTAPALLGLVFAACGPGYGMRVPDHVVEKLPFESRIELLEAENQLAVAIDKRDEAHNEILRTRDHIRQAKERLDAAEDEEGDAPDEASEKIAEMSISEAEARIDYLRAVQDVNLELEDLEELALRCAAAQYEQTRLETARKTKVEGSENLDPKEFEAQVKSCEADLTARRARLKANEQAYADRMKAEWEKEKAALAEKTFDARASPYVE